MQTSITWNISQLNCIPDVDGKQDYVISANWECIGANGQYSGRVFSTCYFEVDAIENFIPYENLTKEEVLNWCWTNGVNKSAVEANVKQQIQNQINPPVVSPPLPWGAN